MSFALLGVGKGAGQAYDPDAQAFFTAAGISDTTQKNAVNQLVLDLKSYGIWASFVAIYPIVGGAAGPHSYNLVNPATYQLTFNGGWTHNASGADPDGAAGTYANTGLAPSAIGQDSLSYWFYSTEDSGAASVIMGAGGISLTWIYPIFAGSTYARTNDNTGYATIGTADSLGLFGGERVDAFIEWAYHNGVGGSAASASATPTGNAFYIAAYNSVGVDSANSARNCAFAAIGYGLGATGAADLYTAVQAYETALGRQV